MIDYFCKLEAEKFYHVFNRGNNGENLFYTYANYEYFLKRYSYFLSPFLNTFAYSLLPNHFHLLVGIKPVNEIKKAFLNLSGLPNLKGLETISVPEIISSRFQSFFTSYAKSINKQEKRTGSLFQKPFKRIHVDNRNYLANLVFYIHTNPQYHCIIDDFRQYPWSSYERILKNKPTLLRKNEILEWFSNPGNYLNYHEQKVVLENIRHFIIE
jgi:putative transposase